MKVKRSYPLTSVENVKYDEDSEPNVFYVIFSTYEMTLQAESADEAKDWVKSINDGMHVGGVGTCRVEMFTFFLERVGARCDDCNANLS